MLQRILMLFLVWILGWSQTYCQDFITWKTGDFFKAKVLEVGYTEIFYKKYENLDGPTYIILKSDIQMIKYENGTVEMFNSEPAKEVSVTVNTQTAYDELFKQGQKDAQKYYQGYRPATTGTFVVSMISPLVGLIPAIACSLTVPKEINLMYPNAELMKKKDYYNGYIMASRHIKSKRVWTVWGMAFAVNVGIVLMVMYGG